MDQAALQELRTLPLFAGLSDPSCLEAGEIVQFEAGKVLVTEGDPPEFFHVVLDGELRATRNYGDQTVLLGLAKRGTFVGEITLLLDSSSNATIRALKPCRLFRLSKDHFWQMLGTCPTVAQQIFREMATRVRNLEGYSQQRERLASLGTMAAGLAHELNNPATAARRATAHLGEVVENLQSFACKLHHLLSPEQWELLIDTSESTAPVALDSITRSDREEEVANLLERQGVADGWKLAPAFVSASIDVPTLAGKFPGESLAPALGWLEATLSLNALLKEIDGSTTRISELVKAVKSYSHMDKSPMQEVDIHEGIESTLLMLGHKLKGVTVTRKFDRAIPHIMAYGGELNQVWTNLIDNAIDAVKGTGKICIATFLDDDQVVVEIADNGPGIPPEVQLHIFEPFYTTKGVGSGTGLGLMISNRIVADRHGGEIEFESEPGDTRFKVRLPIRQ